MTTKAELKRLSARQIAALRVCPFCGGPVERKSARGPMPSYCSPECQKGINNASLSDGAAIIKLAKAWRESRGQGIGAACFNQMVSALDTMLAADREAGRPSALYAGAVMLNADGQYFDRKRA